MAYLESTRCYLIPYKCTPLDISAVSEEDRIEAEQEEGREEHNWK